jgi:PAS domain S-box-containing protein
MTAPRRGLHPDGSEAAREREYEYLVEHLQDAVAELHFAEGEPLIRDVNPAFEDVFGYERSAVVGDSLNEWIVPPWLVSEADDLDARTTAGRVNYRRVRRRTATGLREFLYRGIPFTDEAGDDRGFAVYTDLTDESRRQSHLCVLNRIVRHNLRNDLNVIVGLTRMVAERIEDTHPREAERLERVLTTAAGLTDLTEEAAQIDRSMELDGAGSDAVDCASLLTEAVAEARERYPDATFSCRVDGPLLVEASPRLGDAVDALLENAVEHNDQEQPRVEVSVRLGVGDDWVTVVVADNGPRIPFDERAVITGERDITQLHHGSGLGLWLVKWLVENQGGDIAFGESALGGNEVRLRLHRSA